MGLVYALLVAVALLLALAPCPVQAAPFALIGNSLDNTVTVIDTASAATPTAIPISGSPIGIAVNPLRDEAYAAIVTDAGEAALSIINWRTGAETGVIPLSVIDPTGVAVNPAGTRAWVTGGVFDSFVSVVNLDTRLELTNIDLGLDFPGPVGVAVNPAGTRLYVANFNTGTVTVINTATSAIVTTITLTPCPFGCAPIDLAVSGDGSRLYVTDFFSDAVWVIDTATNAIVTSVTTDIREPQSLAIDPLDQNVYVANLLDTDGNGRVTVISRATNSVVDQFPVGLFPVGVAVDPQGAVYVVNSGDDSVSVRTAQGVTPTAIPVGAGPMSFGRFITPVPATVAFGSADYTVTEGAATVSATITVLRSGLPGATIVVPFATASGGTATAGDDYTQTSRNLTFGPTDTSRTVDVPILADAVSEGPETVNLVLGPPSGPAVLGEPNRAVLTIRDIGDGTVQFAAPTFTVSESAGSAVITVTRSAPRTNPLTVTYTATPLTAVPDQDFTPISDALTFAPGVPSVTFSVPILDNTIVDGNRSVMLSLGPPSGNATLGVPASAVLTITNDDQPGVIRLGSATYTVGEAAGSVLVTITRVPNTPGGVLAGNVSVDFATADGSARASLDYVAQTGSVTFGPGETSRTVSVTILDDLLDDDAETFTFGLSNPRGGATLGTPASATVTITDDDTAGTLRFSSATYTVSENAGSVTLTVQRTGGAADGVLVDFTIEDGTARAGLDFVGLSGTLTFGAGNNSATIVIPILADNVAEGAETFRVVLSSPRGGATLGTPNAATVTINDVGGVLQFPTAAVSVNEGTGSVTLTVVRLGGAGGGVLVDFTLEEGTATAGQDYGAVSGTLSFGAGNNSATIVIPISQDTLAEGDETFRVVLSNPRGATLGATTVTTVTIVDDESVLQFHASSYAVREGIATAVVTVVRSGALGAPATVTFTAAPGTATPGQDFTPVSIPITFPPGQTTRTAAVPIINNTVSRGNRSVILSLVAPTGALLGARSSAVLTIIEDDPAGAIRLSSATYTVGESAGSVMVTIMRVLGSPGAGAGNVSVSYTTGNGSALSGLDYTARAGAVTFGPGELTKVVPVTILKDNLAEGPESFTFTLSDPTGGAVLGTPATVIITITDDDAGGRLKFALPAVSVNEGAGSVRLVVQRTDGLADAVFVDFATADGTATAGSDYTTVTGTLTFLAGNTSAIITIPISPDSTAEGNETFRVVLSNPRGGASIVAPAAVVVTIVDDESAIQFGAPAFTVKEGTPTAMITLVRSGVLTGPATVTFTASPGTAVAGQDFTPVSVPVTFPAAQSTRLVPVSIVNNPVVRGNRTVLLSLTNPSGSAQIGTQSSAVLTITEDDQPGVIRLSAAAFTVAEKAREVIIGIVRSGVNLAGNVSVSYATADRTATAGLDYTARAETITFNAGEVARQIRIPIADDGLVEPNETFTFTILGPTSGAVLATPVTATVTIVDDDKGGQVKFSAAAYSFTEGAGNVSISVTRAGGAASDVFVDYTFTDLQAVNGADYIAVAGTLSFAANQASATIVVPILQDLLPEGTESFRITLGNVRGGATLVAPSVATVSILDDESAIQFTQPMFVTREGVPAVIGLVRTGALLTPASVTVTATPGPGVTFPPIAPVVSFPANTASKTLNLTVPNDGLVQGNRTVLLTIGGPTGGAQLGPNATATLVILDDDQPGVIRLAAATLTVAEALATPFLVEIQRVGTNLVGNVSVSYATAAGTAQAGLDYDAAAGSVTFNAGETKKTVPIRIRPDALIEGPETFTLTLGPPTGGATLGTPSTVTITITDDDIGGLVAFAAAALRVDEGAGNTSIRVVRTGNSAHAGTVDYAFLAGTAAVAGTATAGVDYVAAGGSLTFEVGQTEAIISVAILPDSLVEANETFKIRLANPRGGLRLGTPLETVVTIVDDDAVVEFSGKFLGNMPEVVRRGALGTLVTVDYEMIDGTATGDVDYMPVGGTLTFAPGVSSQAVPLRIVNDDIAEAPETFTINLLNPVPAGSTRLGPNASRTFTIGDNDYGGIVQFATAAQAAAEGGTVTLTINRLGGLGTRLTVGWSVTGGTATPGGDFSPSAGSVEFGPGDSSVTFTLTLAADGLAEGDETVRLSLSVPGGGAAELGAPTTTVLTITDN